VYDFEDLHMGLRVTRISAAMATPEMIERVTRDPFAFQAGLVGFREAVALLSRGDADGADAALVPTRALPWPPPVRAVIEVTEGTILLARGDAPGALVRYAEAERLFPGMPILAAVRGSAYAALGRYTDALAAVRAYQKEVGPDALSCTLEGHALEGLGRAAEAAGAYRRALDELPESADAFNGLRRVLPGDQKKELGARFARMKDPPKHYSELVQAARHDGDGAAVDVLLDGLLALAPDDTRALADDVRRKVKAEKFAEAGAVLARGLRARERGPAESVLLAYLYAMRAADKALDAYAAVPPAHTSRAFRILAEDLEDELPEREDVVDPPQLKQLRDLIAAHRKRAPGDPLLWYYEGALHQRANEYEKAERTFAAGAAQLLLRKLARPNDPDDQPGDQPGDQPDDAELFRSRRVLCLFHLKKGLAAYRNVGPANTTFQQLAVLYDGQKDLAGLEKLIAEHRESTTDPEAVFWLARLLYRKAEYGRAVAVYDRYLERSKELAPNRWLARDEMIRSRLRVDNPKGAAESLAEFGPNNVNHALRAAVAAANGDRPELVRLLEESTRNGGRVWFYSDEDFRRAIYLEKYRDLRTKYPDPNPPPKREG
jgi:tetratricopeptide (TPR) repeat protein